MFGGGRGPMGGGGGMLRAAGRAMTRTGVANGGIQDPFASSPASSSTFREFSMALFGISVFLITDEEISDETPGENNAAVDFIKWVFDNTMVKANEVFKKITRLVIELLNSHNDDDGVLSCAFCHKEL
ncbi:hypothetical protein F2Q69_00033981 [Brassica cretica]|uniref:Uncharacterized protein n=1 Tax=Brassica cretica TaxID=69181 RepID=A0A8S9SJV1_BRACR|nr:hypothetical protein F2Q69_00033981 [Brassica cretica]